MPKRKQKTDLNKLPVYEIIVDPDSNTGVKLISLVDDPAIEVKGMFFKKDDIILPPCHFDSNGVVNCRCEIVDGEWVVDPSSVCEFCLENKQRWDDRNLRLRSQKFTANEEKQIIVGPMLIPDLKIYRRDDDGSEYYVYFTKQAIRGMVEKFNKGNNNNSINLMHTNKMAPAYIIESWIVEDSTYDKSKMYGYDLPVGTWFGVVKITDSNFWNTEVKELGRYSFSVEGLMAQKLVKFSIKKDETEQEPLKFALENLTVTSLLDLTFSILKMK